MSSAVQYVNEYIIEDADSHNKTSPRTCFNTACQKNQKIQGLSRN